MREEKMRAAFRKLFKYEMSDDAESETFARGYQAALQESEAGAVAWGAIADACDKALILSHQDHAMCREGNWDEIHIDCIRSVSL